VSGSPVLYRARRTLLGLAAALALALTPACVTTPVTGRSAFNLVPIEQDMELGAQAYQEFLAATPPSDNRPEFPMVKRVVDRLVAVADDPAGFAWEVHLIDDPNTVNAWCMPGGKMAVYTGILPYTQNDAGLAVVMGHEIGHAVARHGTERVSAQMGVANLIQALASQYQGAAEYANVAALGFELLVARPWGQDQELEADHIGLIYMARAGYDPRESVAFWKRMAAGKGGGSASKLEQFLSTHPSDEERIRKLEKLLPEALAEYQKASQP
jgi:predicted Zn-dependent protease